MIFDTVDQRIAAVANEYIDNGKEYELARMLYVVLDALNQDDRKKASRAHASYKRKMNAPQRKAQKNRWKTFISSMTTEELIKFQNTPYELLPDWVKKLNPKIVKNPERNNYTRIYGLVDMDEHQKEISASRITRYMEKHGFKTTDEYGTHLDHKRFSEVVNEIGAMFDQKWENGLKGQKTRLTPRDTENYTESRVTPKGDKMALLCTATGLPLYYLAGYDEPDIPGSGSGNPLESVSRFKKSRRKNA